MPCPRQPCPDHTVCPPDAPPAPPAAPAKKYCVLCGENYDEAEDPYHVDACRDAQKP